MAAAGIAVLWLGAWFGGARDPRIVLSLVSFALVSLVGLSLGAGSTQATRQPERLPSTIGE